MLRSRPIRHPKRLGTKVVGKFEEVVQNFKRTFIDYEEDKWAVIIKNMKN